MSVVTGLVDVLQSIVQSSNDSGNAPVLLMLGPFKFSLNTAVFQEAERSTEYRWASINRFGQTDALQFVGLGDDIVTLPGVIYPDWKGDAVQVDTLRAIASQGRPLQMMSGTGAVLDYFVIQRISDTRSFFKKDGSFRKQTFSVTLKYYGPNVSQ